MHVNPENRNQPKHLDQDGDGGPDEDIIGSIYPPGTCPTQRHQEPREMLATPSTPPTEAVKTRGQANVLDVDRAVDELLGFERTQRKPARASARKSAPTKRGAAKKPAASKRPTRRR